MGRSQVVVLAVLTSLCIAAGLGSQLLPAPADLVARTPRQPCADAIAVGCAIPEPPADDVKEPRVAAARSVEFSAFVDQLAARLASGDIGLQEASDELLQYCLARYPAYLHRAALAEPNLSFRATLARSVFRLAQHTTPDLHGIEI